MQRAPGSAGVLPPAFRRAPLDPARARRGVSPWFGDDLDGRHKLYLWLRARRTMRTRTVRVGRRRRRDAMDLGRARSAPGGARGHLPARTGPWQAHSDKKFINALVLL